MNKIHQFFIVLVMLAFSSASYAEVKYGVSGALTFIEASGTETEGGEKNCKDVVDQTMELDLEEPDIAATALSIKKISNIE